MITALADDNYVWAQREPDLVAMKLALIRETPFQWLRGTARLYWRDLMEPGTQRSGIGDDQSSRVLLIGDPHPENLGTFRASDGTMVIDWDDFDAAGYGPFDGDVRRLAAGLIIATGNPDVAAQVAAGYAGSIATLAAGQTVALEGLGAEPYLDKLIGKAHKKGDARATLDEIAPVTDGARQVAFGDIDPVDSSGVISKRLEPVSAEAAQWIDDAIAQWQPHSPLSPAEARVLLRARRIGAGVASYPLLRYYAVLAGPTDSPDDDIALELKEERDGLIVERVPQLAAAEWPTNARRVVDAQHRLNARLDEDVLLGGAEVGALSLRIHAETAYQKGVSADDLAALPANEQLSLAHRFGAMLGRAHGQALTADGVPGYTVIAPRIAPTFADDLAALAVADAAQITADYASFEDRDLAALVLPLVKD